MLHSPIDISYLPYLFGMQLVRMVKTETLSELVISLVRHFEKRLNSLIEQNLYKREIGPSVYGLFETKHLLFLRSKPTIDNDSQLFPKLTYCK